MASRTRVSFFLDDVAPYTTGVLGREGELCPIDAAALVEVLDYLKARELAGAISVIPGMCGLLTRPKDAHERRFTEVVGRFCDYPVAGIGSGSVNLSIGWRCRCQTIQQIPLTRSRSTSSTMSET